MLELTERTLLADPAAVLATVDAARSFGHLIALDDLGAQGASLAMLPLLAPEIVKLDRSLVHDRPGRHSASVRAALNTFTARADTVVVAVGIETAAHLDAAIEWGASLGQGCLFVHPAALPTTVDDAATPLRVGGIRQLTPRVPSDLFEHLGTGIARTPLIRDLCRRLEHCALELDEVVSVLASIQSPHFTAPVARRYAALALTHPFVAVVGEGVGPDRASGVRVRRADSAVSLSREWTVAVVGQDFSAALIARDLGDSGPLEDRRFHFVLTDDPDYVAAAARSLMNLVAAQV